MFTFEDYIRSMKANLEEKSDLVVENLKKISTYNFYSKISLLDFTAYIEPTRFEVSITMFSMDNEANEIFFEGTDPSVFAGSTTVITDTAYYQVNDVQLDDFFDFYEQNEETLVPEEQQIFADWFHQCWKKAAGPSVGLPSYFVFHDEYRSYDLKNRQWIDDDEKWS